MSRAICRNGGHIIIAPAAATVPSQREPELSLTTNVNVMSLIKHYRTSVSKGLGPGDTLRCPDMASTEPLSGQEERQQEGYWDSGDLMGLESDGLFVTQEGPTVLMARSPASTPRCPCEPVEVELCCSRF